jgi:putative flippase GtrA
MPLKRILSVALSSPLVRFLVTGALNTLLGLALIYALKLLGLHDVPANMLGYAIGIWISYALHASWSFSYRGTHRAALPRYVLVTVLAYLGNLATVTVALYWWELNGYVAQAFGIPPYVLISYLGSRLYVFRRAAS